jgi:hypothetical protein
LFQGCGGRGNIEWFSHANCLADGTSLSSAAVGRGVISTDGKRGQSPLLVYWNTSFRWSNMPQPQA